MLSVGISFFMPRKERGAYTSTGAALHQADLGRCGVPPPL